MQRKFVTNLGLVLFLNLLIKPFWIIGIDRVVQNAVGIEQYGFYYAIFNFSFLLNIILDLGITNFNNKNIAQNNHLLSKHLSSIILLRLLLAIIYTLIALTVGLIIGYTVDMMKMLAVVVFNQVLISFILYLRSNLAGLHLFKTDSIISILDRLIMIIICGFLLLTHPGPNFQIKWFVYAQSAAYIITTIITLAIVFDKAKIKKLSWKWPFFVMILKKSYPYAILVLLMTFYSVSPGVMLERILPFRIGAQAAGIYASAYRLLDAANMIAFLFSGLLLPIFARMIKLRQNVEEMVRLSYSLLVVPAMIVAVCSYFFSFHLMDLLYKGSHIDESAEVFRVLMFCFIPISATYIFGTLLTANGNLRQLNIMASVGMGINIILNLILIPKFSALGAAISAIVTQSFTSGIQILMAQQKFEFRKNYILLFSTAIFIGICFGVNYFSQQLPVNWMLQLIIAGVLCLITAMALKLISIKNLIYIVKYGE